MADIWTDLTDAIGKDMSIQEMDKKYTNTFVILQKPSGEEQVIMYKGFDGDFHLFQDEQGVNLRVKHETNVKIFCKFPERCLFNTDSQALEFIRLPNRQYRRGICKENARIYSPQRQFFNGDGHPWNISTLHHALYPEYPSNCEEAIAKLATKKMISVAINDQFMISHSITNEKDIFHLFFSNKVIGYWKQGIFYIKHQLFKQEVLDNINLFKPFRIEF